MVLIGVDWALARHAGELAAHHAPRGAEGGLVVVVPSGLVSRARGGL
jgi:hypothetical protein